MLHPFLAKTLANYKPSWSSLLSQLGACPSLFPDNNIFSRFSIIEDYGDQNEKYRRIQRTHQFDENLIVVALFA